MAIISSYPVSTPQLADKILGSNSVDAYGTPVDNNPTVQYTIDSVKTLVDQNFVQQFQVSNLLANQGPAGTNAIYNILFAADATSTHVTMDAAGKLSFVTFGTYYISIQYNVSAAASGNLPFLLFRTLKTITGITPVQLGSTITSKSNISSKKLNESVNINFMFQVTQNNTSLKFQMLRDSAGADDGSLYEIPNNQATWSSTPNATLTISKLL
jgi:hypothetical protein